MEQKDVSQEPSRLHLELRDILEDLAQSLKAVRYWSLIADFVTERFESKSCRFKNFVTLLESTYEDYSRAWGWHDQVGTRLDLSH